MAFERLELPAPHGIQQRESLDGVSPELDADRFLRIGGPDLDIVAADAEAPTTQISGRPLVLDLDQLAQGRIPLEVLTRFEKQHHPVVGLR